jgi:hypothetical protein
LWACNGHVFSLPADPVGLARADGVLREYFLPTAVCVTGTV